MDNFILIDKINQYLGMIIHLLIKTDKIVKNSITGMEVVV